ncbi:hypothetical protein B0H11DRAFT_2017666 [Mycena galericulata]|nr:hypothetical protein B0H11DRAFT_2017666 [Mycena galericulata]
MGGLLSRSLVARCSWAKGTGVVLEGLFHRQNLGFDLRLLFQLRVAFALGCVASGRQGLAVFGLQLQHTSFERKISSVVTPVLMGVDRNMPCRLCRESGDELTRC